MNYFNSVRILLFFSLPLCSMKTELKEPLLKTDVTETITEWEWNEKEIKNIANNPHKLSIQDTMHGNTPIIYLLTTLTYIDTPHFYEPYFIIRIYSYSPHLLLKIIKKSDLSIKNNDGKTALDILLTKIKDGVFHATKLFGDYYAFNQAYTTIGNKIFMAQSLLVQLIQAAQFSGYDFTCNKQTTFQLLGQYFSYDLTTVVKKLLCMGIPIDNLDFCTDKTLVLCIQNYDYKTIKNDEILHYLHESNNHKDRAFCFDIFLRSIAQNNKSALKRLGNICPTLFSPLKAFEYALNTNNHVTVPFILRSFKKRTLTNLSAKILSKWSLPYISSGYDKKLYTLFKKAEKKGHYRFCSAVKSYTHAVAAFMKAKKGNYKISGLVGDTILKYSA